MTQLLNALPGALAQGLIWGVMAIGVYITYKVLDIADLTVDGSICTGAAVCTMLLLGGQSPWLALLCAVLAGVLAGAVTGLLHVGLGIPPILAGILTQMVLWSVNLKLLGKANQALPARTTPVLLSQMDVGVRCRCCWASAWCWWHCWCCSSARSWAVPCGPPAATR